MTTRVVGDRDFCITDGGMASIVSQLAVDAWIMEMTIMKNKGKDNESQGL